MALIARVHSLPCPEEARPRPGVGAPFPQRLLAQALAALPLPAPADPAARCVARVRGARPARRALPRSPPRARRDVLRRCPNAALHRFRCRSSSGEV